MSNIYIHILLHLGETWNATVQVFFQKWNKGGWKVPIGWKLASSSNWRGQSAALRLRNCSEDSDEASASSFDHYKCENSCHCLQYCVTIRLLNQLLRWWVCPTSRTKLNFALINPCMSAFYRLTCREALRFVPQFHLIEKLQNMCFCIWIIWIIRHPCSTQAYLK